MQPPEQAAVRVPQHSLPLAGLVDEIVIVDTGPAGRTREVAARFTDKIFDFLWRDDFAAARNQSFSHASVDYCMWLDADDVLLEEEQFHQAAACKLDSPAVSHNRAVFQALLEDDYDQIK